MWHRLDEKNTSKNFESELYIWGGGGGGWGGGRARGDRLGSNLGGMHVILVMFSDRPQFLYFKGEGIQIRGPFWLWNRRGDGKRVKFWYCLLKLVWNCYVGIKISTFLILKRVNMRWVVNVLPRRAVRGRRGAIRVRVKSRVSVFVEIWYGFQFWRLVTQKITSWN